MEQTTGVIYLLLFFKNCASWLYIWVAYILFFIIIIFTSATLLNSVFLVLILIAATIHLWNETTTQHRGYKLTRQVWIAMVLYCGVVVFTLYVFQFLGIKILKTYINIFSIPQILLDNIDVIGYEQFKDDDRWQSFFPYFALLFLSVIASRHVHSVQNGDDADAEDLIHIPATSSLLMDSGFFLRKM